MSGLQTGPLARFVQGLAPTSAQDSATDRELLHRFAGRRDEAALATLVHRHGAMVLRVAQRVLQQKQDAEDVFQATFLVLARKAELSLWRHSLANWLYEVAYRLACEVSSLAAQSAPSQGNEGPGKDCLRPSGGDLPSRGAPGPRRGTHPPARSVADACGEVLSGSRHARGGGPEARWVPGDIQADGLYGAARCFRQD